MWDDLKDYEGKYQINREGDIRNALTQRILSRDYNSRGYVRHRLFHTDSGRGNHLTHRLVARQYLGDTAGMVVDHLDEDKGNPALSNLEIVSQSENTLRAIRSGTRVYKVKELKEHAKVLSQNQQS